MSLGFATTFQAGRQASGLAELSLALYREVSKAPEES